MSKCSSCGKKNLPGFAYCQKCGAPLEETSETGAGRAVEANWTTAADEASFDERSVDDLEEPLLELLESNRKIEAIRLYRERTGAGLAEAKSAVEWLQRRHTLEQGNLEPQLVRLLKDGRKIEAIRLYRAASGARLTVAKDAVEDLARKHKIVSQKAGCLGSLLLVALASGGAWLAWY